MNKTIYLFKDVKTGEYELYGVFVNDAVAIRAFRRACDDPSVFKEDLELYRGCCMDTRTGKLSGFGNNGYYSDEPEFIAKGSDFNSVSE